MLKLNKPGVRPNARPSLRPNDQSVRPNDRTYNRTTKRTTERPNRTTEPPQRMTKQCLNDAASVHTALQNCSIQARALTNPFGGSGACAMITDKILNETVLQLPQLTLKLLRSMQCAKVIKGAQSSTNFQHRTSILRFCFPHNLLCASLRHAVF